MRNAAMEQLDVLITSWQTTMRDAWFLEPADREVPGHDERVSVASSP